MNNTDAKLIPKEENGKKVSPSLPANLNNYVVDIDGTICEDIPNEEAERMGTARVFPGAMETLNKWHDDGHIITFFTSRTEEHRAVTEEWLKKNGFKYHGLLVGKPRGGNYHWLDNAPVQVMNIKEDFWKINLNKNNAIGYKIPG
ncbi:MAG TPA: HAD family acid phosphatase [Bacteroidia bacterium]|nr:HAD family acid phosphatase [Bacteroidia bacterium]